MEGTRELERHPQWKGTRELRGQLRWLRVAMPRTRCLIRALGGGGGRGALMAKSVSWLAASGLAIDVWWFEPASRFLVVVRAGWHGFAHTSRSV